MAQAAPFPQGTLWSRLLEQTNHALAQGALYFTPTDFEQVEQHGITFVIRQLQSHDLKRQALRKQHQRQARGEHVNPFLPYEEALFVAQLWDSHVILLNKYSVVANHLLLVTHQFEEQTRLLNQADFLALATCMAEIDGLAFYNAGPQAGASQLHKHLQLIPLPLAPMGNSIPVEPCLLASLQAGQRQSPRLPFQHALCPLDLQDNPAQDGEQMLTRYRQLMDETGIQAIDGFQTMPYNLLITRRWMLLVPRSRETVNDIPINALGYAGTLLVRDQQQLDLIKQIGPLQVLQAAGVAPGEIQKASN